MRIIIMSITKGVTSQKPCIITTLVISLSWDEWACAVERTLNPIINYCGITPDYSIFLCSFLSWSFLLLPSLTLCHYMQKSNNGCYTWLPTLIPHCVTLGAVWTILTPSGIQSSKFSVSLPRLQTRIPPMLLPDVCVSARKKQIRFRI